MEKRIKGYVQRLESGELVLMDKDCVPGDWIYVPELSDMFRDQTFKDEPVEVELTIRKK